MGKRRPHAHGDLESIDATISLFDSIIPTFCQKNIYKACYNLLRCLACSCDASILMCFPRRGIMQFHWASDEKGLVLNNSLQHRSNGFENDLCRRGGVLPRDLFICANHYRHMTGDKQSPAWGGLLPTPFAPHNSHANALSAQEHMGGGDESLVYTPPPPAERRVTNSRRSIKFDERSKVDGKKGAGGIPANRLAKFSLGGGPRHKKDFSRAHSPAPTP